MGSTAVVGVVGGSALLLERTRALLDELHTRWSRFDPASEISRLNTADGRLCIVSPQTFELISTAVDGWHLTGGRFDPTVLDAVCGAGYRSSWSQGVHWNGDDHTTPSPGCGDIALHPTVCGIQLPQGVHLDVGGIAKGYAAELAASLVIEQGAAGALVSIGGDIVVRGEAPRLDGWAIEVVPASTEVGRVVTIRLAEGAVCTSSTGKRRWATASGTAHHVIEPSSGRSSSTPLLSATAVARGGAGAEIAATAALVAGPKAMSSLGCLGLPGMVVDGQGRVTSNRGFDRLLTNPVRHAS